MDISVNIWLQNNRKEWEEIVMKGLKILVIALSFIAVGLIGFDVSGAESATAENLITSGDYQYVVISEADKTIAVRKISNYGETVTVPEQIDGYTVRLLGTLDEWAASRPVFVNSVNEQNNIIKKLEIPESVQYVGYDACAGLSAMTELILPENVHIEERGFCGALSLRKLDLRNVRFIGYDGFTELNLDELNITGSWNGGDDKGPSISGKIKKITVSPGTSGTNFDTDGLPVANNLYINKGISSLTITDKAAVSNLYIYDKKTDIKLQKDSPLDNAQYVICKKIITCKGAKAVTFAKKHKIDYTTVSAPEKVKTSIKKNKNGYVYSWKKAYVKKTDYSINKKGKWKVKNTRKKASYDIYVKKAGEYRLLTTTKNTNYSMKNKEKVKVVISI